MSFDDKQVTFAGARRGSQWATIGEILGKALASDGWQVRVDEGGSVERNPRLVASGEADFGATNPTAVRGAYSGMASYEGEPPRRNLRAIAGIRQGNWEGFAARAELGITDLAQIAERKLPLRVVGGTGHTQLKVWEHYGMSPELITSWGGKFYESGYEDVVRSGDFDMIVTPISSGYMPETAHWHLASVLYDLRFIPAPADVIRAVCEAMPGGEPGVIPHHLYRGISEDVPAVCRPWRVVITTADAPSSFGYTVAKALSRSSTLLSQTHLSFSYTPRDAAASQGVPLHSGAEAYYQEMGIIPA